mgnify:CR=1 FL=1
MTDTTTARRYLGDTLVLGVGRTGRDVALYLQGLRAKDRVSSVTVYGGAASCGGQVTRELKATRLMLREGSNVKRNGRVGKDVRLPIRKPPSVLSIALCISSVVQRAISTGRSIAERRMSLPRSILICFFLNCIISDTMYFRRNGLSPTA